MIDKLKSRKFWAMIVTAILTTLGQQLGLSEDAIQWIVGIAGSYILGQGIADFGAQGRLVVNKLASRKLWGYVVSTLVVTLGDAFGLSPDITQWFAAAVMTYLVGQGVADAGAQGAENAEPRRFGS